MTLKNKSVNVSIINKIIYRDGNLMVVVNSETTRKEFNTEETAPVTGPYPRVQL